MMADMSFENGTCWYVSPLPSGVSKTPWHKTHEHRRHILSSTSGKDDPPFALRQQGLLQVNSTTPKLTESGPTERMGTPKSGIYQCSGIVATCPAGLCLGGEGWELVCLLRGSVRRLPPRLALNHMIACAFDAKARRFSVWQAVVVRMFDCHGEIHVRTRHSPLSPAFVFPFHAFQVAFVISRGCRIQAWEHSISAG